MNRTLLQDRPFDPAAGLFLAQERRPDRLAAVLPTELSPLQRALLVADGTVTTFLEAWALEPVSVVQLFQRATTLPVSLAPGELAGEWLGAPAGTPVLERRVMLTGTRSLHLFAYAESVICVQRLPAGMREDLLAGRVSLGQLLRTPGFESRREGLWYGREQIEGLPPPVAARSDGDFLTRTYRVNAGSHPLMLITEHFPWRGSPPLAAA